VSTSVSPDLRRIWRGARIPLAILLLIVIVSLGIVLSRGPQTSGQFEPGSYEPGGSHALAHLLEEGGVQITAVHSLAEARAAADGGTLLITAPSMVPSNGIAELRRSVAHLVLIAPGGSALGQAAPEISVSGGGSISVLAPDCTVGAAAGAGPVTLGGRHYYSSDVRARSCYPDHGSPSFVQVADRSGTVTVLGAGDALTNEKLAAEGNAAFGMRLLGDHQKLVWYLPSVQDLAAHGGRTPFFELIPSGWRYGALTAGIAIVLLALWRARRLGPVVREPLPIVVRSAETAEGRARLYRRGGATGHAAETLREAARRRLRKRLGLPRDAESSAIVETVSARTGREPAAVGAVLYGASPSDEAALVRLADELDAVEREVERS